MSPLLRSPRVWLYAAGGWLILTGLAHMSAHVWVYVLEEGISGQHAFAVNAMKQAFSLDPLQPSMWRQFRVFSVSFGLLLLFTGLVDVALAWTNADPRTLRTVSLLATVFWTLAFIPYAFVDPVIQPIVVTIVAVPLHGIAYLTAGEEAARAGEPTD
jgi:hypothetical protein